AGVAGARLSETRKGPEIRSVLIVGVSKACAQGQPTSKSTPPKYLPRRRNEAMDTFNLAQLTKHLTVRSVKENYKDPCAGVKTAVTDTLRTYLKGMVPGNPEVRLGVMEVARGAMTGLLLADVSMPLGAVAVLQAVS